MIHTANSLQLHDLSRRVPLEIQTWTAIRSHHLHYGEHDRKWTALNEFGLNRSGLFYV